jgi:hypothetical protein
MQRLGMDARAAGDLAYGAVAPLLPAPETHASARLNHLRARAAPLTAVVVGLDKLAEVVLGVRAEHVDDVGRDLGEPFAHGFGVR